MHPALTLAVYALAVARVTRLLTADRITEAPRRWLSIRLWATKVDLLLPADEPMPDAREIRHARRFEAARRLNAGGDPPLAVYLLTCPWCASIYVAAVAAPLWYWLGSSPWLFVPAVALTFSYVTGFAASKEG